MTALIPEVNTPTIGSLVDGLDEIAAQPIPYSRLPKRAQVGWAPSLRTWADVAQETPASLLARPKAGQALLRALLAVANEAVRAARAATPTDAASSAARLVERLSERDRMILTTRTWAPQPASTDDVATLLGASTNAVLRHQPRAHNRFVELLEDPAHADLTTHGAALGARLGTVTTEDSIKAALAADGVDPTGAQGLLLTYMAGPYRRHGMWLENSTTGGVAAAEAAALAGVARLKNPTTSALIRELLDVGLVTETAGRFLQSCPALRNFGDRWVRWGKTTAEQIEAVLHLSRSPTTAEVIGAVVGDSCSAAVIRSTLFDNPRFVRATQHTWGLREWGGEEYAGIYGEILSRVDVAGAISVADLVREMKADFPDVAESSIRQYASRPAFVVDGGLLRRRTPRDGWPPVPALNTIRGVFRNGENEIRVSYVVDHDLLRGSGQSVSAAVAAALGISPGEQLTFAGTHGNIKVTWRLSATKGPSVGSLRLLATAAEAQFGDELVVVFKRETRTVSGQRIAAGADLSTRLATLLGRPVSSASAALARGLSCPPADVAAVLRARGDSALVAAINLNSPGPQRD
jgi:hypothetical protein